MADIIDTLAGIQPHSALAAIRRERPQAVENAQRSFEVLLEPEEPGTFPLEARYAVAARAAALQAPDSVAAAFYAELREEESGDPSQDVSRKLAAGLDHTRLLTLHPWDARAHHLRALEAAGWSVDDIVTLSQLVSFLAFQIRVVEGLRTLAGLSGPAGVTGAAPDLPHGADGFTQESLGWKPWLAPVPEEELTTAQREALVDDFRIRSDYFRLLVRNPEALQARTLTDKDIFYTVTTGLPRADREIAATAASRLNGCVYCASVHARRAAQESGRHADVQLLLDDGTEADLGERWSAIARSAAALTRSPGDFGPQDVQRLQGAGLGEADIVDAINGAAFFNWANRLMLSLGGTCGIVPPPLSRTQRTRSRGTVSSPEATSASASSRACMPKRRP
ncbi:alkylhydroperoxidase domain protein [Nesterenkonia suensis]